MLTTKVTYLNAFFSMWSKCSCAFKCTLSRAHRLSNQFVSPHFVLKACHIKLQFKSSSLKLRSGVTSSNVHSVASLMACWPSELAGVGYQKNSKGEAQLGFLLRGIWVKMTSLTSWWKHSKQRSTELLKHQTQRWIPLQTSSFKVGFFLCVCRGVWVWVCVWLLYRAGTVSAYVYFVAGFVCPHLPLDPAWWHWLVYFGLCFAAFLLFSYVFKFTFNHYIIFVIIAIWVNCAELYAFYCFLNLKENFSFSF